jgi:hypothetical protein
MAEHKRDLQAGRKRIKVRETKPRERAALKAAIAIVERVSPESIKKLALEQGTRKPQTSATVKTSTATGTKAGPAPKPRYKLEGVTGDKRRDSISGVVTSKAPSPLLPTGRYYRKSQYVRDLDEPV